LGETYGLPGKTELFEYRNWDASVQEGERQEEARKRRNLAAEYGLDPLAASVAADDPRWLPFRTLVDPGHWRVAAANRRLTTEGVLAHLLRLYPDVMERQPDGQLVPRYTRERLSRLLRGEQEPVLTRTQEVERARLEPEPVWYSGLSREERIEADLDPDTGRPMALANYPRTNGRKDRPSNSREATRIRKRRSRARAAQRLGRTPTHG
jgi:hypothetical protein